MSRRPRQAFVLATLLAATQLVSPVQSHEAGSRIPARVFSGEPRGPYRTGTIEELWVDAEREEVTTSDPADRRHLMVQIWYPASFRGDPPRAPYVLHPDLYPRNETTRWLDDVRHVITTSVLGARLAQLQGGFPVLIYNPGASHPQFSATFQTEYLASHGYVVVAIGHTGITGIERFPDGYVYRPGIDLAEPAEVELVGLSRAEQFRLRVQRYAQHRMPIHVQDLRFVLDRLRDLNQSRDSRLYRGLDLDRVGALGWSIGGALSLQASRDEPRIKAAVNLDGWLYTDVQETGTSRPIMIMHGEPRSTSPGKDAAAEELAWVAGSLRWKLYASSTADWYDFNLPGADHHTFSDRPLFEPADPAAVHPRLSHQVINQVTLEFFDRYLRGSTHTPLLDGDVVYPDTVLHGKAGHFHVDQSCKSLLRGNGMQGC